MKEMRDLKIVLITFVVLILVMVIVASFSNGTEEFQGFLLGMVLYLTMKREVTDFFNEDSRD